MSQTTICSRCGKTVPGDPSNGPCPDCGSPLTEPDGLATPVTGAWQLDEHATDAATTLGLPGTEGGDPRDGRTLPRAFAGYELLCELGSGGMGVVYKARQVRADRVVALKLIKGTAIDGFLRERFRTEAQALAQVRHPNIVQVFDVGEADGVPYFSMEYVPGGSLTQRLRREKLPFEEAARLTEILARAVEAAHQAGVLHRDLKPSNVLLTDDGEPRITDFGLAKRLGHDDGLTATEDLLGTPGYMAPEQCGGKKNLIGPATDVYTLGATLFEMLAGRPPFRGNTPLDTLNLVLHAEPAPPSRLRRGVPAELEAICLKCLEKEPGRRYASAAELADDVGRFRRGESTIARPLRWPTKLWRAVLRRRAIVTVVALLLLTAIVSAGLVRMNMAAPEGPPDPDAALHDMERELDAGRGVALVGETGPPRWFRSVRGGGAVTEPAMSDGVFAFQSLDEALVELLPDPRLERYQFTADVRQDSYAASKEDNGSTGGVGIYFAWHRYEFPTRDGACQGLRLTFLEAGPPKNRPELPWISAVNLWSFLKMQPFGHGEESGGSPLGALPFIPVQALPGPWRKLKVEVRPGLVRAFWQDEQTQEFVRVANLGPESLRVATSGLQMAARERNVFPESPLIIEEFRPRSGLGLYAFRGTASFRNVAIEPLPPEE